MAPKPKHPKEQPKLSTIDTRWFRDLIIAKQLSQRKLAKALNVDPAAVSLMLRGKRGIDPKEAELLARELGVPMGEVLEHIGIDTTAGAENAATVRGWVNGHGEIHMGKAEGPRRVPAPIGMPAGTAVLRYQGEGYTDGFLAYYVPGTGTVTDCLGKLSVVQVAGKNEWYLRVLKRGYSKGTYTLVDALGAAPSMEDVRVASATPVVWLKTTV